MECYVLAFFTLQGGGLFVFVSGTATLTNSNVYSNTAVGRVSARIYVTFSLTPLERAHF